MHTHFAHSCTCACVCTDLTCVHPTPAELGTKQGLPDSPWGAAVPTGQGTVSHPLSCARPGVEHPRCIRPGLDVGREGPGPSTVVATARRAGVGSPLLPLSPPCPSLWGQRAQQGHDARGHEPPPGRAHPDTCRNSNVICPLTMGSLRFIFNYNICTNLNSPLFINNAWVCVYRCLINLCLRQLKACKIPKGGGGERLRGAGVVAVPAWSRCCRGRGAAVVVGGSRSACKVG